MISGLIGFRTDFGYIFSGSVKFLQQIQISAGYEVNNSVLSNSDGSYEVMLKYYFDPQNSDSN